MVGRSLAESWPFDRQSNDLALTAGDDGCLDHLNPAGQHQRIVVWLSEEQGSSSGPDDCRTGGADEPGAVGFGQRALYAGAPALRVRD